MDVATFWMKIPLDDEVPNPARQQELELAYEKNIGNGQPPYHDVPVRSLGELKWIIAERGWSTPGTEYGEPENTPDLRGVSLKQVNLTGVSLGNADLRGAKLSVSNLTGARLRVANLEGAELASSGLVDANLEMADLRDTHMAGADLTRANLHRANLSGALLYASTLVDAQLRDARLGGATLTQAVLEGADLTFASLNSDTTLAAAKFDGRVKFRDVYWNGVGLAQTKWDQVVRIGDETEIAEATGQEARAQACGTAAAAYRGLYVALQGQGLTIHASRFRKRERELEQKALWESHNYSGWLASAILRFTCGYGESIRRALVTYVIAILAWTVAYFVVSEYEHGTPRLSLLEALVLSLTSFHGRGFLSLPQTLGGPISVLASLEAVVGLFVEALLIATLARYVFRE